MEFCIYSINLDKSNRKNCQVREDICGKGKRIRSVSTSTVIQALTLIDQEQLYPNNTAPSAASPRCKNHTVSVYRTYESGEFHTSSRSEMLGFIKAMVHKTQPIGMELHLKKSSSKHCFIEVWTKEGLRTKDMISHKELLARLKDGTYKRP